MNKIEKRFGEALLEHYGIKRFGESVQNCDYIFTVESQVSVGIYFADFVLFSNIESVDFVVEIDGHEAHKTKEQRFNDYRRERFLQKEGYIVIRFTGSEVFVDPYKCIEDIEEVIKKTMETITEYSNEMCSVERYYLTGKP